jgi:hypothetical protein
MASNPLFNGFTRSRATNQRSPQMKYILISLAAVTLMTGGAFAGQDIRKWHCVELKANWANAPTLQCPVAFIDDRVQTQPPSQPQPADDIPAPPPTTDFVD